MTETTHFRSVVGESGELAAGVSGWTWGVVAGIGMTWVREDARGTGLGERLLVDFEGEARARGCTHVFPTPDAADVHLRKEL